MAEDLDRRVKAAFDEALSDLAEPPPGEPIQHVTQAAPKRRRRQAPSQPIAMPEPQPTATVALPDRQEPPPSRRDAALGWWAAASPNLRGSIMMVGAFTLFTVMVTCIKLVGSRISIPQILIVRQIVMMAILFIIAGRALPRLARTRRPALQFARGLFSLGAMMCGFTALVNMPLAEATAIGFSQVLFVTLAAIVVLHEVVDGRRWVALAAGFCGVLIMLKPTGEAFNAYAVLAIVGAICGAGITITVRILGDRENTITILLWQGAIILLALALPGWWSWQSATAAEWTLMILLGVVGLGGQWLITRAYQIGEASALAPLDFVRLLLATLSGYLVFAEIPGVITVAGAALVVGGTLYTMRRNAAPRVVARSLE